MIFKAIFVFIIFLINAGILYVSLARGKRDSANHCYNLFLFCVMIWNLSIALSLFAFTPRINIIFVRMIYGIGLFIPSFFILLGYSYSYEKLLLSKLKTFLLFIPAIISFGLIMFTPIFVSSIDIDTNNYTYYYGSMPQVWSVFFMAYFSWAFLLFFNIIRKMISTYAREVNYTFIGTVIASLMSGTVAIVLPYYLKQFSYIWLGPIFLFPLSLYLACLILNDRLNKLEYAFKTTLIYSALTILLILFYFTIGLLTKLFEHYFSSKDAVVPFSVILCMVILAIPLKNIIYKFFDKTLFSKDYYKMSKENIQLKNEIAQIEKYKSLAKLTGNIAEEMQPPLTTMQESLLALKNNPDDKQLLHNFSDIISSELKKLLNLVQQLMDYSNPSPIKIKSTNAHDFCENFIHSIDTKVSDKNIKLTANMALHNSLEISLDESRIRQVINNITDNAIDAMPNKGQLFVTITHIENALKISLRDTGCGIAKEELPHVFEPFYTSKKMHSGLGLSAAKVIIDNHKGTIAISSQIGLGSTVDIRLPLNKT